MFFQRLDSAAGCAVIGSNDGNNISLRRFKRLRHAHVGLGRLPVLRPKIRDNLDVSAVDQRL